ncbi:MAG: hypothetical protein JWP97_2516 [Labilithrix sp.]|nr:hypothetical protein [Labilithrix sp.]
MKSPRPFLAFLLLGLVLAAIRLLTGCGFLQKSARPATAAARLAICAEGPIEQYTPCCLDVAREFPLRDGGARSTDDCYLDGGR